MAFETERKFLVNSEIWEKESQKESVKIEQGFLNSDPSKTIRIRIWGKQALLTIKGALDGITRQEFEYEIPLNDARELLDNYCDHILLKTRHWVNFQGNIWEVDEFHGANSGLMIAEIELASEHTQFDLPDWVGEEVSHDLKYLNVNLSQNPFKEW